MSRGRSAFQIAAGLDEDGNYLDGTGEQEAHFLASASWHERKRYRTLKREHREWLADRRKTPKDERGPMMRVGERQCPYCGAFFEPPTLRQRFCPNTDHRQRHHRRTKAAGEHRNPRVTSRASDAKAARSVTPGAQDYPICEWCRKPISNAKRSTKRYHDGSPDGCLSAEDGREIPVEINEKEYHDE